MYFERFKVTVMRRRHAFAVWDDSERSEISSFVGIWNYKVDG